VRRPEQRGGQCEDTDRGKSTGKTVKPSLLDAPAVLYLPCLFEGDLNDSVGEIGRGGARAFFENTHDRMLQ